MPEDQLSTGQVNPVEFPGITGLDEFPDTECQESKDAQFYLTNVMHEQTPRRMPGEVNRTHVAPHLRNLLQAGSLAFIGTAAIEQLALNTPHSRRKFLLMLLAGTGVVAGLTLRSQKTLADSPDAAKQTGVIQLYEQGGADWRWGLNWQGATNNQYGNLTAPPSNQAAAPQNYLMVPDASGKLVHFLEKRGDQTMSVLIDQQTNSHQTGTHRAFVGSDDMMMPSVPAQIAFAYGKGDPFALVTSGGLEFPGGLVVPNPVADLNKLATLANPNTTLSGDQILTPGAAEYLVARRLEEVTQLSKGVNNKGKRVLPGMQAIGQDRLVAQNAADDIKKMLALVDKIQANKNNPLIQAGIIATELFADGYVAAVALQIGGHDTHGEKDGAKQMALNQTKFTAADAILTYAEAKVSPVQIRIEFISDFGRAPTNFSDLNSGDPNAHHGIGRGLFIGEGVPKGGRVIGAVDNKLDLKPGTSGNYADLTAYRESLAGVDKMDFPVNTKLTDATGTDVIAKFAAQKTN
ncbi:hypothetical protein HZA40_03715 [Candidatus Peregrinibacteria bacterium]|nr:hypothetical protein [Candidatus Peregrinibacteria bacterium]